MKFRWIKYIFIFFLSCFYINGIAQKSNLNSIIKACKNNNDTIKLKAYLLLGEYYFLTKPDTSLIISKKGLYINDSLLKKITTEKDYRFLMNLKGEFLNNIAYLNQHLGNIDESILNYNESLQILDKTGDVIGKAATLNNLGTLYKSIGDYNRAIGYFLRSIQIRQKIGENFGIAQSLYNIGNVFYLTGSSSLALNYFNKSIEYYNMPGSDNKRGLSNNYDNIGIIHFNRKDFVKSKTYLEKALSLRKLIGDRQGVSKSLLHLAQLYEKLGNVDIAKKNGTESLVIASEIRYPENIRDASEFLFLLYRKNNDNKKALEMHLLFTSMKDSIYGIELQKKIIEEKYRDDFKKKETIAKEEQIKKDIKSNAEKTIQRIIRNSIILCLFVAIIFILIIFRSYRNKKAANKLIAHQKKQVEDRQKDIIDSIHYAKRIQQSLLPTESYIQRTITRLLK